jgi:hypothetical protein
MAIPREGNGKKLKKNILKFENNRSYHQREMKKMEIS